MSIEWDGPAVAVAHLRAPHDVNGNPRRAFLVWHANGTRSLLVEGYEGTSVLPPSARDLTPVILNVTAREYARLLREGV